MVWGLFPLDPLPGENEYYIFGKGTYKVGRKGCDIITNKDKAVSRVHAEIIVNEMVCMYPLESRQSKNSSKVQIRDCSRYGTFIIRNPGSKEKVHEFPNRETTLKDGDTVQFGTGIAQYRFSYVPLVLCAWSSKPSEIKQLQAKMSSIGASVTQAWTSRCTHMVIDDFMPLSDEIINSIVAKKPLVRFSWIELIAGNPICTEIPSSFLHAPTLILEGASLKVADKQSREKCLHGYTFMLESTHKYKFKEKLHLLLDAGGAKVVYVETSEEYSQHPGDSLVCVIPAGMTSSSESFKKFNGLPIVNEIDLISAVVSGHLDPSVMTSAPVLVTSSCSTDETVVPDSDEEMETATSVRTAAAINLLSSAEDECETKMDIHDTEPLTNCKAEAFVHVIESTEHDSEVKTDAGATEQVSQGFLPPKQDTFKHDSPYQSPIKSDKADITLSRNRDEGITTRKDKGHLSDSENPDIIYSQSLIVRQSNSTRLDHSSRNGAAVNFKRFRKPSAPSDSGNSFYNLIPFAKYPYKDSDYGNEDVAESIKEEKKRKQMEAIADDLFNNEKGRRRGASDSLPALFGRG